MLIMQYLENYKSDFKNVCGIGFSDHGFRITYSQTSANYFSLKFLKQSEILISTEFFYCKLYQILRPRPVPTPMLISFKSIRVEPSSDYQGTVKIWGRSVKK